MAEDRNHGGETQAPLGSLRPGVTLNGGMFAIERLIAEGGMGEVYKGFAVASGDAVAIKLVRPDMARHPEVMALFKREASILHNLQHDAIPRYYVFSVEPELQRAYIAMEFVDGVSLQNRLTSGPLSTAEVRVLLKRIGGALELAHANGVIHRDISADNIILPSGDTRRAKIVDFGIARATQSNEATIIGGGFAGKYKYVSPEQLGLAGGEVTPKSDIYSFGLVIAEALQGKAIDMGATQAEVIERRKTTPDLSGVDISLRPLLTAMLAPDPQNRPASMAEVAEWGETAERTRMAAPAPVALSAAKAGRGRPAAIAAAVVLLLVAAAGYVLRDSWLPKGEPPVAVSPQLPSLPSAPTPTVANPAAATPTESGATNGPSPTLEAPSAAPTAVHAETPTLQGLLEELPPKALQAEVSLPVAAIGAPMRAELPAFVDPGGKGLALHVTPAAPPGLAFRDLGGGRGAVEGTPTQAGARAFDVVAINPHGKSARMTVTLTVSSAPPKPAQSVVDLEPATLGAAYSAALPPFRSAAKLNLRAENVPAGLAFADLGGGLSQLAGQPAQAGRFRFDVVAATPDGVEGRMTVGLNVAPGSTPAASAEKPSPGVTAAPSSPLATSVALTEPAIETFLRQFDAAPCFAVHPRDDGGSVALSAIGADRAAFERFESAYRSAYGRDPEVRATLVTAGQCPAADLLRRPAASPGAPPRLTLDTIEVGKGRPLAGAITQLRGRGLLLIAIVDDGRAVRLKTQVAPGGDAASFSLALSGDAQSLGKPEVLLAIASDRPLSGFDAFRSGPSADLLSKIGAQWREAGGSAALALFKLVE